MKGRCVQCAAANDGNPDGVDKLKTVDLLEYNQGQDDAWNAVETWKER
jgi:hypothetical protein